MSSRIAQFRLTHAPTNQYLKRIGKVDSARCPACGEDEENGSKHRKRLSMETLLGTPELTIPLANYIEAAGRMIQNENVRRPKPLRPYIRLTLTHLLPTTITQLERI
ncbi:hypothetical protein BC827DRAFT_1225232, partial [Russula dissimulans]